MRTRTALVLALAASLPALAPAGAAIDGAKPLLCAITEAIECNAQGECLRRSPETMNLPQFIRVDAGKKLLSEYRGERSTRVLNLERDEGRLLLQGIEQRPWSMSISQDTGKMSMSASDAESGFVVFGACTEL